MQKLIISFVICVFCTTVLAKNSNNNSTNDLIKIKNVYENSYVLGLEINDISIQENALINILSLNVNDTVSLYRLLEFYFKNDSYTKSFLLSQKYLELNKNNIKLLEFYAESAEMIDRFTDAKIGYQKLYLFTSNTYYDYLFANAEYMLGNYNESLFEITSLEKTEDVKKRYVSFVLENKKTQDIVIQAALYYLKGKVLNKLNHSIEESKVCYLKALEIQPDFVAAQVMVK